MYRELEEHYKKQSQEMKTRKYLTVGCLALVVILYIIINLWVLSLIIATTFLLIIIIIIICRAKNNGNNDKDIIKQFLEDHGYLDSESLKTIIQHYLIKGQTYNKTGLGLSTLLTAVSILVSLINSGEFTLEKQLLAVVTFIVSLTFYSIAIAYKDFFNFYTGNDDLYRNLEEIITKIYLEMNDNSQCIHKKGSRKNLTK